MNSPWPGGEGRCRSKVLGLNEQFYKSEGRKALSALNKCALNKAHPASLQLQGDLGLLVTRINNPNHESRMLFLHVCLFY